MDDQLLEKMPQWYRVLRDALKRHREEHDRENEKVNEVIL